MNLTNKIGHKTESILERYHKQCYLLDDGRLVMSYNIVESATGLVRGCIMWDGNTATWPVPAGCAMIPCFTNVNGVWTPNFHYAAGARDIYDFATETYERAIPIPDEEL